MHPVAQPVTALPAAITLVVGLGERGGRVVGGLSQRPPFSDADTDPRRHLGRMTLLSGTSLDDSDLQHGVVRDAGRYLAGKIVTRLEKMLTHTSATDARELEAARMRGGSGEWRGPTQTLVVLIADIGESSVREALGPTMLALEDLAGERLKPVFSPEATISDKAKNLVVLPALFSPHVRTVGDGQEIVQSVEKLYNQVRGRARDRRTVPALYLLEHVTSFSILESADADAMLENFCLFAVEGLGAAGEDADRQLTKGNTPGGSLRGRLLYNTNADLPLGTFSVARAESAATSIREYLRCHVALRLLKAVKDADPTETAARGRARAELLEAVDRPFPTDVQDQVRKRIEPLLGAREEPPGWRTFKEKIVAEYGPDRGNPVIDDDKPQGEDEGWLRAKADAVLSGWRGLLAGGFDDLVDQFRTQARQWEVGDSNKVGVRDRIRATIDDVLAPRVLDDRQPTVLSYRDACQHATRIVEGLKGKCSLAVAERDRCLIEDDPSLSPLREAHASLLSATRAIPAFKTLAIGASLFAAAVASLLGPALHFLGAHAGLEPGGIADFLFVQHPYPTAAVLAALVCALVAALVFYNRYRIAKERLGQLWDTLAALVLGPHRSVLSFFLGRLQHAWHVGWVGALNRTCEAAERDLAHLRDIDRALLGAIDRYKNRLAALGVVRKFDGTDDVSGFLPEMRRPLVWSLVDAKTAADFVQNRSISGADLDGVLSSTERNVAYYSRWREESPFLDDEPLDRALNETIVEDALSDRVYSVPEFRDDVVRNLLDFARIHRRSLPLGLQLPKGSGEPDGLILPSELHELLNDAQQKELDAAVVVDSALKLSRVYAVRLCNGINAQSIEWLKKDGKPSSQDSRLEKIV